MQEESTVLLVHGGVEAEDGDDIARGQAVVRERELLQGPRREADEWAERGRCVGCACVVRTERIEAEVELLEMLKAANTGQSEFPRSSMCTTIQSEIERCEQRKCGESPRSLGKVGILDAVSSQMKCTKQCAALQRCREH